jgi:hypothetical protein
MRQLASKFQIYALDTSGYGNSSPIGEADPTVADFASVLGKTLAALGLESAPLYARHTSAKIALEYAAHASCPPGVLILDGLAIRSHQPDEKFIQTYMHHCPIDTTGAFLAFEWTRIRDMMRWFPWFDRRDETRVQSDFPSLDWLEPYVLDVLSAGPNYAGAYAAAMRYDPTPTLQMVHAPTIVAARADDVLYNSLDLIPETCSNAISCERLPADDALWLAWLAEKFGQAASDSSFQGTADNLASDDPVYVDLPHGQMLVHRAGTGGARPLMILDAPTPLHAHCWCVALSDHRHVLIPELPGYGESDPISNARLEDYGEALMSMLGVMGATKVDILAIGLATPLALALNTQYPDLIDTLIIDGLPAKAETIDLSSPEELFPAFDIELSGAYLHRMWHYLRDFETRWPWFDGSASAQRAVDPILDGMTMYRSFLGMLKQPGHYGDVGLAALRAPALNSSIACRRAFLFDLPGDPSYAGMAELATRFDSPTIMRRPTDLSEAMNLVTCFLKEDVTA